VETVRICLLLVGVATVVAVTARKLSVPAPSLLVVVGLIVGLIPAVPPVRVDPNIVSLVVLPPLLYAAGEELAVRELRRVWRPVTVLAVGLVAASAVVVAVVAHAVTPLALPEAFILGAVLASTDPVAVAALGRRLALPPRVQALVQAESLFNDATSLILFRIAVGITVAGGSIGVGDTVVEFLILAVGGTAIGVVIAGLAALLRKYTVDPIVETVISLVTPYVAFVVAEQVHASGVTAVVVASVIAGAVGPRVTSAATRLHLHAVHQTTVFVLESVVFGLIGLELPGLLREERRGWILPAVAIAAALLVVRVAWVFPLATRRTWHELGGGRGAARVTAVVSWAGARGVVPLAAALSIPLVDDVGAPIPYRNLVLVLAIGVIVISLVVQGFTLAPLVRRARLAIPHEERRDEVAHAWRRLSDAALSYLDSRTDVNGPVVEQTRRSVLAGAAMAAAESGAPGHAYRQLRRDVISCQNAELRRLYREGEVSEQTRRALQRQLDLQAERFDSRP
jgi:CPA1 family monovalent cation:H+ antiporter